jgi:hypothetical protein
MSINGNGDTLTITGARLKVSGGVQVSGSIAYTDDATGFGGVSAQIDTDNTLNITAGKTSGVAKIERGTTTNITGINHANVSNNTTIHIALKNTSSNEGDFVTIGTFADDDNVKVNYTDEYVIGPGETGMLTLRKVAGVLSLFIREMFSSTATNTDTKPFYIKDGTNYKYPLYKTTGANLITETIGGVTYYRPSSGLKTKTRPPLGIPELIVTPTGNLAIGNNGDATTINYDVWGVPASFNFGSIYQGTTKKASFVLENGEASGSFTESGASSGDAYSLYVERTDTSTSDTVSFSSVGDIILAFHHDTFANSGDPYGDGTLAGATANAHVFADTQTGTYDWGTLGSASNTSTETTYTWTPPNDIEGADVLMVAGGGGGGKSGSGGAGGGGGAGGAYIETGINMTTNQKTIIVGNGGNGSTTLFFKGSGGQNTSFTGLSTAIGGGGGGGNTGAGEGDYLPDDGGSGGGGGTDGAGNMYSDVGLGTFNQGFNGGSTAGATAASSAGGGGASGVGQNTVSNTQAGAGGSGLDITSRFGTLYGVSGVFAGGGGGGNNYTGGSPGDGGSGGGGSGGVSGSNGQNATKHTGSGGGGSGGDGNGGDGGSGIVLIKSEGTGKTIPKVTGASFDSANVTFTVQDASNITNIKYTINGGSEQTTPVGTLVVAHGLYASASITVVAYAVDANGAQISTKKTVTGTIPTPTFDIALTNYNLVITATLTNIVNPDPYYTVSIHDTNTQLASHIFQTTDTNVVLTWNETVYGEKSYTVKINGTTSSTETITIAPAYRTGTSQGFTFISGQWKTNGYSAVLDDETNSSGGKLVEGVRQWEWDMPDAGGGRLYTGDNNWIYFVPGTAEDNGTWYQSSTSTDGTAGTRNGRVISMGVNATFDETDAFVDGLVPYGDIP